MLQFFRVYAFLNLKSIEKNAQLFRRSSWIEYLKSFS